MENVYCHYKKMFIINQKYAKDLIQAQSPGIWTKVESIDRGFLCCFKNNFQKLSKHFQNYSHLENIFKNLKYNYKKKKLLYKLKIDFFFF